ncbi:MAG: hypothetical protein U0586_09295 [Candidatus Brocadiaceae bacterium]
MPMAKNHQSGYTLILSHFDKKDKNKAYRDMVQGYSKGRKKDMGRFSF